MGQDGISSRRRFVGEGGGGIAGLRGDPPLCSCGWELVGMGSGLLRMMFGGEGGGCRALLKGDIHP